MEVGRFVGWVVLWMGGWLRLFWNRAKDELEDGKEFRAE